MPRVSDDDEIRINTLHRFTKHSPKLVLHEYSHCEVPAGCGGVVLRWIDPTQGLPATLRFDAPHARAAAWLDGNELASSLTLVRPGVRLFALHIKRTEPVPQEFAVTLTFDSAPDRDQTIGATWRSTTSPPPDGWIAPTFDDGAWGEPRPVTQAILDTMETWRRSSYDRKLARGQSVFALETDELWLRVAVTAVEP